MDDLETQVSGELNHTWPKWLARIQEREKAFENGWWKAARDAERMYDCPSKESTSESNPFNILYANTEVLLPSLYSATPRPDVTTRFKGGKKEVSEAVSRFLTTVIDMNSPGKESFDNAVEQSVVAALVPGMGYARVRAYPDEPCPVRVEGGSYDTLIWGYAKKWVRVPWLAFRHRLTKEDIKKRFKLSVEQALSLSLPTQAEQDEKKDGDRDQPEYVYELWIKEEKRIVWLTPAIKDAFLEEEEDILRLAGFYPTCGPLTLVAKPSGIDPTPLYQFYKNQAEELNRVTVRLNKVLSAIRVRGAYNPLLGKDLENILSSQNTENGLVAATMPLDLQGKGIEGHIWLMPLDKLIAVAKELYVAREQVMKVIQQITGLADIVRGSTVASETATAQNLKNKWGTIRLKRMQRIVALYVRDTLRLTVDAASTVMPPEQWRRLTQLPFPTAEEKSIAEQQAAMQVPPMPGQPPPPTDPILQMPTWEEVIGQLSDDGGRIYIIDIETNSTVEVDATEDKRDVMEFMAAMGQLLQGLAPVVQLGPSGLNVAKEIVLAVASKFKLGREVEESLKALQMPQGPDGGQPPDPKLEAEKVKMKLEVEQAQQEHELKKVEQSFKMQQMQRDEQLAAAEFKLNLLKIQSQEKKLQTDSIIMDNKEKLSNRQAAAKPAGT